MRSLVESASPAGAGLAAPLAAVALVVGAALCACKRAKKSNKSIINNVVNDNNEDEVGEDLA